MQRPRSADVFCSELRICGEDLFLSIAVGEAASDYADGYARPLDTRVTVMDLGVNDNSVSPSHGKPH